VWENDQKCFRWLATLKKKKNVNAGSERVKPDYKWLVNKTQVFVFAKSTGGMVLLVHLIMRNEN